MTPVPNPKNALRWLIIGYGAFIFLWLGREDSDVVGVTLLGCIGALLMIMAWLSGKQLTHSIINLALIGLIAGIGTSLVTAGLMTFKNVRHAHIFPDYPWEMVGAILTRAPIWAVAGALFGIAGGLIWHVKQITSPVE